MFEEIEKKLLKKGRVERKVEKKTRERRKIIIMIGVLLGMITVSILLFLDKRFAIAVSGFFVVSGVFFLYFFFRKKLKESSRVRKIEDIFPDFLQLMASNLRAGMTIDRAMLLSSRPEFNPLDKEILESGKEIATGKSIEVAMVDMAKRIRSEKVHKTILLIISGISAGGNLAVLLEETAVNMRERGFVEKKASSSVLMYVIFIFIAVSVGAPALFSLSGLLVETLTNILSGLPVLDNSQAMVPFTLSSVSISINFIKYYSLVFIIVIDVLAALILGLVSKGEEKEGLKYLTPLLVLSIGIFFVIRYFLSNTISALFG